MEQGVQGNIHYDVLLFYSDSSLAVQSMWKNREDPFSKGGPIWENSVSLSISLFFPFQSSIEKCLTSEFCCLEKHKFDELNEKKGKL